MIRSSNRSFPRSGPTRRGLLRGASGFIAAELPPARAEDSRSPAVDPSAPFGSRHAFDDPAKAAPGKSRTQLRALYADVMNGVATFTETAHLAPGSYALGHENSRRLGLDHSDFEFTREHGALINGLRWWYMDPPRFSFVFDAVGLDVQTLFGGWPVATVNFKRPFGDMAYFEKDMAALIDLNFDKSLEPRLFALYRRMAAAVQAFVMRASI